MYYNEIEEACFDLSAEANTTADNAETVFDLFLRDLSDDAKKLLLDKLEAEA